MTEEQRILKLVEEKKITAEEAQRLLAAVGSEEEPGRARFLKVKVYDPALGRVRVNVTLPLALVRWGMKFVPESAQMELNQHNISLDQVARALETGFRGKLVEVEDNEKHEKVEVYLE